MTTKKKRFLGSPLSSEIADTIRQGQEDGGYVNVELIPLTRIDVDEDNPRRTGFRVEDLADPARAIADDKNKRRIWDGLVELATSIKAVGVQQPIKVYRHRERFRIAFGERRFLASLIAEKTSIPAWILQEKPTYLRNIQYIENMQREDLTAWERVSNVAAIVREFESFGEDRVSVSVLTNLTGMSRSRASHYLSILSGPEDVRDLLRNGDLNNVEKAGFLSRIKDDLERRMASDLIIAGNDASKVDEILDTKRTQKPLAKGSDANRVGRPRTRVNLGQTANTLLLKRIMTSIPLVTISLPDDDSADWNDLEFVSEQWKRFLAELEREVLKGRQR